MSIRHPASITTASASQPAPTPAAAVASSPHAATAERGRGPAPRWVSPRLSARELLLGSAGALALAVITSWPLVAHLSGRIAPDLGDPLRTAWQVAWEGHALTHSPLRIFQTNAFWPHPDSLAFSDSLLGFAPLGALGSGVTAALVRYNLLFLLAFALAMLGVYLLGRELGLRPVAAAVAGAAFAYAPFRAAEAGHLHVISSGGMALSLFLLLRGYRRGRGRLVLAGWLVGAWQLSLGFTLGLQFSYLLAIVALVALVLWLREGRTRLSERVIVASLIGVLAYGAVGGLEARPYLKAAREYPSAKRKITEVQRYSAPLQALIAAPRENRVWGSITGPVRRELRSQNESVLFPGLTILLLALLGLGAPVLPRTLRWALLAGAATCAVLACGLGLTGAGYPYRILFDLLPGWDAIRTPGRIITMASLALALLAGAGAHRLLGGAGAHRLLAGTAWRRISPRVGASGPDADARESAQGIPRPARRIPTAVLGAVLVALVVFEGAGHQPHPHVPAAPAGLAALPGPRLDLPTDSSHDRLYVFWSVNGFPTIANGVSTFDIPAMDLLRGALQNFPDRPGVEKLRRVGIRTIVLHTDAIALPMLHYSVPEPPDPVQASERPITGLPLTRRRMGSVVIYDIAPLSQAAHAAKATAG